MKVLTIIGNGFDLGHGLPTRFDDFMKSSCTALRKRYDVFRNTEGNWSDVENRYEELLCEVMLDRNLVDVTDEIEYIIQGYGLNEYGEVDYYNYTSEAFAEEYDKIANFIRLLSQFEQDFLKYLKDNCSDGQLKVVAARGRIKEILSASTEIINFNYTNTLEVVYGVDRVVHIHGNIDNSIAIGSGTLDEAKSSMVDNEYPTIKNFRKDKHGFAEMMGYYEEDMDGNLVENHAIKNFFDEVSSSIQEREEDVFSLLDEKSKDSLALRKQVIEDLRGKQYDAVYIIGHSLGTADYAVLDAINRDTVVHCFYHGDESGDDFRHKKKELEAMNFKFELLSDADLYEL